MPSTPARPIRFGFNISPDSMKGTPNERVPNTDDNGNSTIFINNNQGYGSLILSPDSGQTRFVHDEGGRVTARINANKVRTKFDYDEGDRFIKIRFPDPDQDMAFTYDQENPVAIADGSETCSMDRDESGRLIAEARTVLGADYKAAYS